MHVDVRARRRRATVVGNGDDDDDDDDDNDDNDNDNPPASAEGATARAVVVRRRLVGLPRMLVMINSVTSADALVTSLFTLYTSRELNCLPKKRPK